MSIIDTALTANRNYARRHDPKLGQRPAPKIAVVTCMDPRARDPSVASLTSGFRQQQHTRSVAARNRERIAGRRDRQPTARMQHSATISTPGDRGYSPASQAGIAARPSVRLLR
jgi:hypothetical protein